MLTICPNTYLVPSGEDVLQVGQVLDPDADNDALIRTWLLQARWSVDREAVGLPEKSADSLQA